MVAFHTPMIDNFPLDIASDKRCTPAYKRTHKWNDHHFNKKLHVVEILEEIQNGDGRRAFWSLVDQK